MTLPASLASEIQKLAPSAIIELYELDASSIGGGLLYFHSGTNKLSQNITWQGQVYVRYPIVASGFEFQGQGQFARPKLQVSNALSAITAILMLYNDLLGAKVTRKRTCAKFLDAVNFPGSVNPTADPTAGFDDDIYFIDRKSSEDQDGVEFELASNLDVLGVTLPARQIIQNTCTWKYRGAECGYTGGPVIDETDVAIPTATSAPGLAVVTTYAALVTAANALKAAQNSLAAAAITMNSACEYGKGSVAYSRTPPLSYVHGGSTVFGAYYVGVAVVSGVYIGTYRIGGLRDVVGGTDYYYEIEKWGIDATACTAATTAYTAATAANTTAQANYDAALAAYDTALGLLPSNDTLYQKDVCGKRLASCKARFGATAELPFGSFPAAGLIQ